MSPTTLVTRGRSIHVADHLKAAGSPEDPNSVLAINGAMKLALFNGHSFEVAGYTWHGPEDIGLVWPTPHESLMLLYCPVDPRIVEEDVRGARRAFPNADNTGWLFEHCDNDAMVDYLSLIHI